MIYTIDEVTGAMTPVGASGAQLHGLAFDPVSGKMYGCDTDALYEISMANGAANLVGYMSGHFFLGIAFDGAGNLYGLDIGDESLYSIDPSNAATALIGDTGLNLNYAQDMAYDINNDILYLSAYTVKGSKADIAGRFTGEKSPGGELYTCDTSNGAATYVEEFLYGAEITGFAIPYTTGPPPCNPPAIYPVEVVVKNYGHYTETFDVHVDIFDPGMNIIYCNTATVTNLAGGAEQLVSLPPWDATSVPEGLYTVSACTMLADENPANDCRAQQGLICICFICADANGPYVTDYTQGFTVLFDASGSYGPCPSGIYEYTWDFGDGSMPVTTLNPTIMHTYTDPCPLKLYETYTVTLIVECQGYPCADTDVTTVTVYGECYEDPPIVQWIFPEGGETLSGNVNLQWFAHDDHDPNLDIFIYAIDGGEKKVAGPIPNTGSYMWSSSSLSDGTYDFAVEAFSGMRIVNFDTAEDVIVDNGYAGVKVADVEITDVTTGSTQWVKNGDTVRISASITAGQHLNSWEILADLSGFGLGTVPASSFDGYTASWQIDHVRCSDGAVMVTVRASGDTKSASITADNSAPEVTILKPANGLYLFDVKVFPLSKPVVIGSITFDIDPVDNYGISKAEFYVDDELKAEITEPTFDWDMNLRLLGQHDFAVKVYDLAGNSHIESMTATIWNIFGS
jgi:hypothetical protein